MSAPGRLLYLNFRFIYRVSQWFRRRFSPAGLLVLGGVVASGIFGIDTRQSLAFQVFAITVSLLVLAIIGTLFLKGNFRFHRRLPEYGTVTRPMKYQVTIDNLDDNAYRDVLFRDELSSRFPAYEDFRLAKDPEDLRRNWLDRKLGYPRLMSLIRNYRGGSLPLQGIDVIPARDEKDVEVTLQDGVLSLKGEKKEEHEEKEKERYLYERSYGAFQRSFTLPSTVDETKVKAEFTEGVLKITLPKSGQPRGRKIEIGG